RGLASGHDAHVRGVSAQSAHQPQAAGFHRLDDRVDGRARAGRRLKRRGVRDPLSINGFSIRFPDRCDKIARVVADSLLPIYPPSGELMAENDTFTQDIAAVARIDAAEPATGGVHPRQ
nr:hypothetical protein [Tanacetum cinerariifolium]